MKTNLFIPKHCSVSLVFILAQGVSYAMPGSGSGAAMELQGGRIVSAGKSIRPRAAGWFYSVLDQTC